MFTILQIKLKYIFEDSPYSISYLAFPFIFYLKGTVQKSNKEIVLLGLYRFAYSSNYSYNVPCQTF